MDVRRQAVINIPAILTSSGFLIVTISLCIERMEDKDWGDGSRLYMHIEFLHNLQSVLECRNHFVFQVRVSENVAQNEESCWTRTPRFEQIFLPKNQLPIF